MKIAVCYSGLIRTFKLAYRNHIDTIFKHYDCDTYFSFWNNIGHGDVKIRYDFNKNDEIQDKFQQEIIDLCNPKLYEFEDFSNFESRIKNEKLLDLNPTDFPFCKNSLSMHYKIFKCHQLVLSSNINYDVILRIRPDHHFTKQIQFKPLEINTIFTSLLPARCSATGINDQVAYGNMDSMTKYSNLFNYWVELSTNKHTCIPEFILKGYVDFINLMVKDDENLDHWIIKEDGSLR